MVRRIINGSNDLNANIFFSSIPVKFSVGRMFTHVVVLFILSFLLGLTCRSFSLCVGIILDKLATFLRWIQTWIQCDTIVFFLYCCTIIVLQLSALGILSVQKAIKLCSFKKCVLENVFYLGLIFCIHTL